MYNRRYFRQYVILNGSAQFFPQNAKLAGNAVIEIKNGRGKVTVEAQGLMKASKLNVFFIFPEGEVEAGELIESGQGKGILKKEFLPDQIGNGWKIEALEGIAAYDKESLVFSGSVKEQFQPRRQRRIETVRGKEHGLEHRATQNEERSILQMQTEIEVSEEIPPVLEPEEERSFVQSAEDQENIGVDQEKIDAQLSFQESESVSDEETQDKKKMLEEALLTAASTGNIHDTFRQIASQFRKEMDMLQAAGIITPEEAARVMGEEVPPSEEKKTVKVSEEIQVKKELEKTADAPVVEEKKKTEKVCFAAVESKPEGRGLKQTRKLYKKPPEKKRKRNRIEDIFMDHEHLFPFPASQGEWVSITPREIALLPVKSCRMISSSFVSAGFSKYRHLILGREDGKMYLGIPDKFFVDQQSKRVQDGYRSFLSCEEGETKDGCCGYWIMNL